MDWGYVTGYFDGEGTAGVYGREKRKGLRPELIWANTNLESLQAIQNFIGAGHIRDRCKQKLHYKQMYALVVSRKEDIARIIPLMLPHAIIKREALLNVQSQVDYRIARYVQGGLKALGVEEVRRLYHDEGLSTIQIGAKVGVTYSAVKNFMKNNGIPRRTRKERGLVHAWSAESRRRASESRKKLWTDPAYRSRAELSMKRTMIE